jgi:hypothetical protein
MESKLDALFRSRFHGVLPGQCVQEGGMRTQSAKREARGARETKMNLSIKMRPDFPLSVILAHLRYLDASQGREAADKHLRWLDEHFLFADDGAYRIDLSTPLRTDKAA